MPNVLDEAGAAGAMGVATRFSDVTSAVKAASPPLLFGLRLWGSVCLALYVAFWLQLDNAYWAGTTAALVCQPHLGASLRKGWFRMIGTLVGAVVIVALTAWFPQNRAGFLIGLALWGAACALVATLLRNFSAYGAALAGYTAAIIASDELGATGGSDGLAFTFALTRVTEIWIGIACAGIVLAGTDFGGARRQLAALLAGLSAEIAGRFSSALAVAGSALSDMQPVRRERIRQVIALDPIIDQVKGESSILRYHSPVLQAAVDGLFEALAGWCAVVWRLARLPDDAAQEEAGAVLRSIPLELRSLPQGEPPTSWMTEPIWMRRLCDAAARSLIAMPADTPSVRLLADQTVCMLAGLSDVLDGLALLLADPNRPGSRPRRFRLHVPDWLPALVSASRALVIISVVELFWIVAEWPNGAVAITWAAISVILFAPKADEAYAQAANFTLGTGVAAVCAAVFAFAILPNVATFAGLSIVLALYLIPVGALMAQPWRTSMFVPMAGNFVPLLGPANQMSYDTVHFYNAALAIAAGSGAAALSFRLIPPLSPALRSRRLLALTLRDLRRLATTTVQRSDDDWKSRIYKRLEALPDQAEPLQRAQLVAALSVGTDIIHLRRLAPQMGLVQEFDAALAAFARGDSTTATAGLSTVDLHLASLSFTEPESSFVLRERARVLAVCDALVRHGAYFDTGASA